PFHATAAPIDTALPFMDALTRSPLLMENAIVTWSFDDARETMSCIPAFWSRECTRYTPEECLSTVQPTPSIKLFAICIRVLLISAFPETTKVPSFGLYQSSVAID